MKLAFLSSTLLLSVFFAQGQNTSPYWSINSNNNTTLSHKIGTTNNVSIRFVTNNTERMKILSTGNVGIGVSGPTAKLEIYSPTGTPPFIARLNGQIKLYVHPTTGGVTIGHSFTPPTNGLFVNGNVGIGINTPAAKLHVDGDGVLTKGLTISDSGISVNHSKDYAIKATSPGYGGIIGTSLYDERYDPHTLEPGTGVTGIGSSNGVYGEAASYEGRFGGTGVFGLGGTGVFGRSYNYRGGRGVIGQGTIGVHGDGEFGISGFSGGYGEFDFGAAVYGRGGPNEIGQGSVGGYFYAEDEVGIFAKSRNGSHAAYFDGSVYATGIYQTSDIQIKHNVKEFTDAIELINKLRPKYYEFKTDPKLEALSLPKGSHYGLIAQDLEKILPELVKESKQLLHPVILHPKSPTNHQDSTIAKINKETIQIKAINYTELIPIMVKGMQELDSANKAKDEKIAMLEEKLNEVLVRLNGEGLTSSAWMKQNTPNPVRISTTIQYFIPDDARTARILISNAKGQQLKIFNVSGSGTVNFSIGTLPSGTYNYILVVDGKTISTRKLVVAR